MAITNTNPDVERVCLARQALQFALEQISDTRPGPGTDAYNTRVRIIRSLCHAMDDIDFYDRVVDLP